MNIEQNKPIINANTQLITVQIGYQLVNSIEYQNLINENFELKSKILLFSQNENFLNETIKNGENQIEELQKENEELRKKIKEMESDILLLKEENKKLNYDIYLLKEKNIKFDALVKLNECNAIVNKNFKKEYRKWYNLQINDYVPNINDIIEEPPNELDNKKLYDFWNNFLIKYPRSDDL